MNANEHEMATGIMKERGWTPKSIAYNQNFQKINFFSKKQIAYYTVCSKHIGKTYLLCYYSNTSSSNVAVPAKQRQIMISQVVSHGRCHRRRLIRLTDNILTITFSVPFPRPIYRYWTAYKPLIELFEIQYMYPEFRLH